MRPFLPSLVALIFVLVLAGEVVVSAPAPPLSTEEHAVFEMRRIEKLAADPKADPDKLWQDLVDFRRDYPAQPQVLRAAELMSQVRSPLGALDRKQVSEDRPPWLPKEVVAVLGDHRGRDGSRGLRVSPDGKWVLGVNAALHVFDAATLHEHKAFFKGICGDWSQDGKVLAVGGADDTVWLYEVAGGEFRETAALVGKKWPPRKDVARKWPPEEPADDAFPVQGWEVESVGLTADRKRLVAVSANAVFRANHVVRVWDLTGKVPTERAAFDESALGDRSIILPGAQRLLCELLFERKPGDERALVLWDITGEEPRQAGRLSGCRFPVALAPDGRTLAVARAETDTIQLWDIGGREPRAQRLLPGKFPHLASLAFTPDGNVLVCGVGWDDNTIRQVPVNDAGRKRLGLADDSLYRKSEPGFGIAEVQVFPDGKTLALGGGDGALHLWDLVKGEAKFPSPRGHLGHVAAAAFSPDGKTLITAATEDTIRLWRLDKGRWQERQVLRDLERFVWALTISPDGKRLAAVTGKKEVRLWQLSENGLKDQATFEPHSLEVYSVAFSGDSATLVTGGSDRGPVTKKNDPFWHDERLTVRLWDLATNPPRERLVAVPRSRPEEADTDDPTKYGVGEAFSAVLSPNGKLLACAAGGAARVWKVRDKAAEEWAVIDNAKRAVNLDTERPDRIDCVAISPDGKTLATGGYYCRDKAKPVIYLWDLTSSPPRQLRALAGVERSQHRLAFSGDGRTLFSTFQRFEVSRWAVSAATGDEAPSAREPWRKVVRWDVATGRLLGATDMPVPFNDFALAPDGRHLVTCNANGTAYVFRLASTRKAD